MRKKHLIIIMIISTIHIIGCTKSNINIENYLNTGNTIDSHAKYIMPNLDDLPKYKNIEYKYTHKSMLIFQADSVALIVNYDDETYKKEKDKLSEKYKFLDDEVLSDHDESKYVIPEHKFSINSYAFKVVNGNEESNTQFPKSFGMIGTSEEKKSIAYLYFYDMDLDYIAEKDDKYPMADFVKDYFQYDF